MSDFTDLPVFTQALIRARVTRLIRSSAFQPQDRSDLEQELLLRALERWPLFDPKKGSPGAFLACIVARHAHSLRRDRWCEKRDDRHHRSLQEIVEDEDAHSRELGDRIADPQSTHEEHLAQLRLDLAEFCRHLPQELQELAEALQFGNVTQAARGLDRSRTTLYVRLAELRKHAEHAGLRDYLNQFISFAEHFGFRPSIS